MQDRHPKDARGFAGLEESLSQRAQPQSSAPAPAAPSPGFSTASTAGKPIPLDDAEAKTAPLRSVPKSRRILASDFWVIATGIVLLIVAMVFAGTKKESSGAETTNERTAGSWPPPASPAAPASPQAPPIATVAIEKPRPSSGESAESKPPIGSGLALADDQIRYCLSQTIRIDSWKLGVDQYSGSAVDALNASVSDYNSRCGSFKYRRGSLERIRADVELRRSALQLQGKRLALQNP